MGTIVTISFFAVRCYASVAYVVMQCLSVCPSVTFVHSVETNKHIFKIYFSPLGSHTILGFSIANGMAIFQQEPPNWGVKCRWGRQIAILSLYLASLCAVNAATGQVL